MSSRHAGYGHSGNSRNSRKRSHLVTDNDDIGLVDDADVSNLPHHIQSKIFSVVSQTSKAHLNDVA
jgi:hypothetical protein